MLATACGFSIGFESVALFLEESGFDPLLDRNVAHIRLSDPSLFTKANPIAARLREPGYVVDFNGSGRKAEALLGGIARGTKSVEGVALRCLLT